MKRRRFELLVLAVGLLSTGSCRSSREGETPDGDCRGPGRYEAGKGSPAVACCKGLKQLPVRYAAYEGDDSTPVCTENVPLFVYACVEGTCGDGRCEAGESAPCSCPADCPSAVWPAPAA